MSDGVNRPRLSLSYLSHGSALDTSRLRREDPSSAESTARPPLCPTALCIASLLQHPCNYPAIMSGLTTFGRGLAGGQVSTDEGPGPPRSNHEKMRKCGRAERRYRSSGGQSSGGQSSIMKHQGASHFQSLTPRRRIAASPLASAPNEGNSPATPRDRIIHRRSESLGGAKGCLGTAPELPEERNTRALDLEVPTRRARQGEDSSIVSKRRGLTSGDYCNQSPARLSAEILTASAFR